MRERCSTPVKEPRTCGGVGGDVETGHRNPDDSEHDVHIVPIGRSSRLLRLAGLDVADLVAWVRSAHRILQVVNSHRCARTGDHRRLLGEKAV